VPAKDICIAKEAPHSWEKCSCGHKACGAVPKDQAPHHAAMEWIGIIAWKAKAGSEVYA